MLRTVSVLKMRKNLGQLLEQKKWRARRDGFVAKIDAVRRRSRKAKRQIIERDVAEAIEKTRARLCRRPA